jgi:hypothetical protein
MFRINDPGLWQYYHQRLDNRGLNAQQLKQKYLTEQRLFEQQQLEDYLNNLRFQGSGGGEVGPESTPQVELRTQNGQVLQTQNGLNLIMN